ncbi:MAG: deoxyribodipyrimidine photo-lyase [Verrucomicrobiota bacterium]
MKTVLHWFRRDLRVSDNTALSEAARRAELVIPVFLPDESAPAESSVAAAPLAFFRQSLGALKKSLADGGHALLTRPGRADAVLPQLCRELGAQAVFANKLYEPEIETRDQRTFHALNAAGFGFELFKDAVIQEESDVLTQAGKPFTVFTPYSKAWNARRVPAPVPDFLPPAPDPAATGGGESAGHELLRKFMSGPVHAYATTRDLPHADGTSRLSPHLHWGTVGIRTVMAACRDARARAATPDARKSCDVFLNELVWREFFQQVLHHFPHVTRGAFRPELDALKWSDDKGHFSAWCEGRTGYPVVDAAMRCLNATGWMHNRLRMIVAMFLTKDLLLPWQWGERYFMRQLVDADLAANNGGWQWSAGTGTDAAPYFRIFNPVSQSKRFDPDAAFIAQWLPELAAFPAGLRHEPWLSPLETRAAGYPDRIVLHEEQRPKCLAMFEAAKRSRPQ